jgi:hypothetical protein
MVHCAGGFVHTHIYYKQSERKENNCSKLNELEVPLWRLRVQFQTRSSLQLHKFTFRTCTQASIKSIRYYFSSKSYPFTH